MAKEEFLLNLKKKNADCLLESFQKSRYYTINDSNKRLHRDGKLIPGSDFSDKITNPDFLKLIKRGGVTVNKGYLKTPLKAFFKEMLKWDISLSINNNKLNKEREYIDTIIYWNYHERKSYSYYPNRTYGNIKAVHSSEKQIIPNKEGMIIKKIIFNESRLKEKWVNYYIKDQIKHVLKDFYKDRNYKSYHFDSQNNILSIKMWFYQDEDIKEKTLKWKITPTSNEPIY